MEAAGLPGIGELFSTTNIISLVWGINMRNKYIKTGITGVIVIIFIVILLQAGTISFLNDILDGTSINRSSEKLNDINKYEIDIELDDDNKVIKGKERITYFNKSTKAMEDIYFHVYPNAFNNKENPPVMFNDSSYAYPEGFNPCYIKIASISAGGKRIKYSLSGLHYTTLKLELDKPLKVKEHLEITIDFQLKIPTSRDRIGHYDGSYIFANWYPVAAVYDEKGWNLDPFYDIGDPFYSDVADYMVNITLPEKYILASTGENVKENVKGGMRTQSITAKSVRDFAWAASNKFKLKTMEVDGVKIKCYFINSNTKSIDKALSTAAEAIRIFNKSFGGYPYTSYSVVESLFPTGMEYPGMVLIPNSYFEGNKSMLGLEGVIVHETAHQWWYGVVGNNEVDEAWFDEGLATYSKVIYFEKVYGAEFAEDYYNKNIKSTYESKRKNIKSNEITLKPLYEFEGWREYDTLAYKKAAIIFHTIRKELGDEKFYELLGSYYNKYKFKNATTKDFIRAVEGITNKNWDGFFDKWLMGK